MGYFEVRVICHICGGERVELTARETEFGIRFGLYCPACSNALWNLEGIRSGFLSEGVYEDLPAEVAEAKEEQ